MSILEKKNFYQIIYLIKISIKKKKYFSITPYFTVIEKIYTATLKWKIYHKYITLRE